MTRKLDPVSVGCAFLKYETKEQAITAIEALNGLHKMEVFQAQLLLAVSSPLHEVHWDPVSETLQYAISELLILS